VNELKDEIKIKAFQRDVDLVNERLDEMPSREEVM
jgi:hypothetical protein